MKRDSRRTPFDRHHSPRPSKYFYPSSFLRSAAGLSSAVFPSRGGNESRKLFKTSPRAMATCTRERENEVIRQSNRSERRFNQANGKLEAGNAARFFPPLERIQVDYALHTRSSIFPPFNDSAGFHVFLPQIFARAARYAHPIKKKGDESLNTIQKSSQDFFNEIRRKMNDWLGKEERDFFFNTTFL